MHLTIVPIVLAVVSGSLALIAPGARYFSVSVAIGRLLIHNYSWVWMPQYTFYQYVLVPQEDILMKSGLVETGDVRAVITLVVYLLLFQGVWGCVHVCVCVDFPSLKVTLLLK